MKSRCVWLGCSALAGLLVTTVAFADAPSTQLGQIVVTATRTAQAQDATLAPVTVIDRAEIELLQPSSLQDLLSRAPGIAIDNKGGPGKASNLFLRGTNADQVLILVDGIRIGSATTGTAAIQDIPVDQIERVEIVRGPFSSLYGSEAIGGVIQIFLRHAPGAFTPNASLGFGSYARRNAAAGFSSAGEQGWFSLEASHDQTHGINACRVGAAQAHTACFADQPDKDGFRNNTLTLHGAYRFNDRWSADGLAMRSQGFNEYDGTFSDSDDYVTQVTGAQLHFRAGDRLKLSLRVGSSADFIDDFLRGVHADHFNTRRTLGSFQADIALAAGLLTTGMDWQRESIASSAVFAQTARIDRGVFAQWQRAFGVQSLQASLRRDRSSQFGGKTTGSLLWGWGFAPRLRFTASYGTAFRAPTFNELYFPGFGNPQLTPESSRNVEIGLRGTPAWGQWSLNAYRDDIRDMITFDAAVGLPANVDRVHIVGLEGVVGTELAGWTLRATATLLNARDAAADRLDNGNELPRRPRQSARFDADRKFGRFSFGASWYVAARRYDDLANQHPLSGYALTDLRAGWLISRDWKLQLALNNVFGKDYETARFYNQPGRNFMLTLSYRPGGAAE